MYRTSDVSLGSYGTVVLLLQEILRARGFKGADGKDLGLDKSCGYNTVHAINAYQSARRQYGVELGTNGKDDGICGQKMWADLIAISNASTTSGMCTADALIARAKHYIGYREKSHAGANMEDFTANAGSGNYQKFQPLAAGSNGDYWCQYFIDGIAVEECGSRDKAKKLLCQDGLTVMTGYTPTGVQCFKNAGRWYTTPKAGDIVYFYTSSKGRVSHVGIVVSVNESAKTFKTVEGNSNSDGFTVNGGCVASHEYSYKNVGGKNRVNGFGRPRYDVNANAVGGDYAFMPSYVGLGSAGNSVLLLQEILKARGFNGINGIPLGLDKVCGNNTVFAINAYQTARRRQGVELGTNGRSDGCCGPKMWNDLLAF